MNFNEIPQQTPQQLRQFGLLFGGMIALVFGVVLPFLFSGNYSLWPFITGAIFALWALAHPASLKPIYRGWMRIALVLGFINTRIIMFILFYGIFLPIGFLMRLFGWDAMHRKLSESQQTYRVETPARKKDHMSHPF
ncbi:MAG: hypothetical protein DHS20C01_05590 [marine bacterium B5-7]|nr:MAG: hypothetical protein DHS20C01_05590 [marine bacterium B5-7]